MATASDSRNLNAEKLSDATAKLSDDTEQTASNVTPVESKEPPRVTRRPSEDDFTKMSMLSMRGGGFFMPKSANPPESETKLPEIPERPTYLHQRFPNRPGGPGVNRTQSERYPRRREVPQIKTSEHEATESSPRLTNKMPKSPGPSRIPSFRIPSKLKVMPKGRVKKHDDFDDDTWNQNGSGNVTPIIDQSSGIPNSWSFSSNEGGLDVYQPRSRAATFDRRQMAKPVVEVGVKSSPLVTPKRVPSSKRSPRPHHEQSRMMSKRRSVSDVNIPLSLQQAEIAAARQSVHFDESSHKGFGKWLAKMLLGSKQHATHRIRRLSRDVVMEMMERSDTVPEISRVLFAGEAGVGKRELVRTFRSIGAPMTHFPNMSIDETLDARTSSISDSSMLSDEIDPSHLLAFEYNEKLLVLDFIFADTEEEYFRLLIQKPPHLIVCVYAVCSVASFDFCLTMMDRLRSQNCEIPLALVGNKSDLIVSRTVGKHESRNIAKQYGITLLEVSALLSDKCPELLLGILRQLTKPSVSSKSSTSSSPQHESATPQHSSGSAKSNTIWSRLTKTFSTK